MITILKVLLWDRYTREDINAALQSENPLEIVPSTDEIGHGTSSWNAAGNPVPESDFYGIANSAEFVVVKLKPAKAYLKDFSAYQKMLFAIKKMMYYLEYSI